MFDEAAPAEATRRPLTAPVCWAVTAASVLMLWFHLFTEQAWVPFVDSANLALHEAGHPLIGMFSNRLMVYGGTIFQLLFPYLVIRHFLKADDALGVAAGRVWFGENLLNVARYMADARAQLLPLVGGGEHDWTEIFTRWGVLTADTRIAGLTRLLGIGLMGWAVYRLWLAYKTPDELERL